jgi:hypothetical protein
MKMDAAAREKTNETRAMMDSSDDDVPRDTMLELAFVDDDSYSRQAILDGQWRLFYHVGSILSTEPWVNPGSYIAMIILHLLSCTVSSTATLAVVRLPTDEDSGDYECYCDIVAAASPATPSLNNADPPQFAIVHHAALCGNPKRTIPPTSFPRGGWTVDLVL